MNKEELSSNLIRRISHLIDVANLNEEKESIEMWRMYYKGYINACKQILNMIEEYE